MLGGKISGYLAGHIAVNLLKVGSNRLRTSVADLSLLSENAVSGRMKLKNCNLNEQVWCSEVIC